MYVLCATVGIRLEGALTFCTETQALLLTPLLADDAFAASQSCLIFKLKSSLFLLSFFARWKELDVIEKRNKFI